MTTESIQTSSKRLGIQYYPDVLHYTLQDLQYWLPRLSAIGAHWLILRAPLEHTIPEYFLEGLIKAGIEPVITLNYPPEWVSDVATVQLLLKAYANWGIHYISFFDRPNIRTNWPPATWAQQNLVERFLDVFLPLANNAIDTGLPPVFPALEPGGDYWDTAFLRAGLGSILRRGQNQLIDHLALGAYAWLDDRPLNWGAGGPERWPGALPYRTQPGHEDQIGFRIFDWYLAISQAVLKRKLPVLLLGAGPRLTTPYESPEREVDELAHAHKAVQIARLLAASDANVPFELEGRQVEAIPPEVLVCTYSLLAAAQDSPLVGQAWFQPQGHTLPAVDALAQFTNRHNPIELHPEGDPKPPVNAGDDNFQHFPIAHYLLLPRQEWGITEWHLDMARPYILKYHPTIGFSPAEAAHAAHVLVIGDEGAYPEEIMAHLRHSGCYVECISGDGTVIATELANR